jgi:uncharacterized protein (DUF1778 family)
MATKPRAEAPARMFQFRLSPDERKRLEIAAAREDRTLSDFARLAVCGAVEDCLEVEAVQRSES